MTYSKRPDGNIVAEQNREATVRWLHRFGGLTTRQLARLVWPGMSAGMRMAQITIRSLLDDRLVLVRSLHNGGSIYVLGDNGARLLRKLGVDGASARGHRDLVFKKPMHRFIANEFLIDQHQEGLRIWTEFEVQRRLAPVPEIIFKSQPKLPDGVIDNDSYLSWVEVENSFKSRERLGSLVQVANHLFGTPDGGRISKNDVHGQYDTLVFVSHRRERLLSVLRCLQEALDNRTITGDVLRHIDLVHVSMSTGFIWGGPISNVSAEVFLTTLAKRSRIQSELRNLLKSYGNDLQIITDQGLWELFVESRRCSEIPFEDMPFELRARAPDYDSMKALQGIVNQANRTNFTRSLSDYLKDWLSKNIGFTMAYYEEFVSDVARSEALTTSTAQD